MSAANAANRTTYGLVAEYAEPEDVLAAANAAREAGYRKIDAYTPFPVEGLDEALGASPTRLGWVVLFMGIIGAAAGFFMQWYANVHFYPLNIGGKPLNSWPNFIVISYEFTILFAAFSAGIFMFARNGLPQLHHPIFNAPNFERATRDRFFLCVEASDSNFDFDRTRAFLEELTPPPLAVSEVEA